MSVQDFTIYDVICRNAQCHPDGDAVIFNEIRLTHGRFKDRCDQLARGLVRAGVEKGDRLGIVAHNCHEFMILYGAVAKIGAILLPINWRFQQEEMEYVLKDCTPRFVFAGPEYRQTVKESAKRIDSIERCFTVGGGDAVEGFSPFEELCLERGADGQFHVGADSGFVIIHTAAVEGEPRGALLSQSNIIHSNLQMMIGLGLGPEDSHIAILPLFHIAALSMAMAVMHAGGKNVILERFDPELSLRLMEKERVTLFFHFPPILQMLLSKYDEAQGGYDLSSLRNVGGLDSPENIKRLKEIAPNAVPGTMFGQTEALPVTWGPMEERPGSAGRPTPLSKVILVDEHDNEVPVGTPGEICVRSPVVFSGYWGRAEDTAYTFRNGWHHTGDIGRFDQDGYLWYVKRKAEKELIKPGGENVYPAEVERVILEHDCVKEVSVIGVPDKQWGEAVKAVCVLKPEKSLDIQDLIDFVASRIARYKKPKHVVFVDSLPRTEDGTIDREQVKRDYGGKF
ncbi:MAG: AMP-binding protein [Deltaproteobacteria bacterium]|nr:AMP-binding protein [Deltaproteobacteria bacterium]